MKSSWAMRRLRIENGSEITDRARNYGLCPMFTWLLAQECVTALSRGESFVSYK
jgi:hypothetical protein